MAVAPLAPSPELDSPVRGFPNPAGANHCYVNAALQALSTIPQLAFILTASAQQSRPAISPVAQTLLHALNAKADVASTLAVVRRLKVLVAPPNVADASAAHQPGDSVEFLHRLFHNLHAETTCTAVTGHGCPFHQAVAVQVTQLIPRCSQCHTEGLQVRAEDWTFHSCPVRSLLRSCFGSRIAQADSEFFTTSVQRAWQEDQLPCPLCGSPQQVQQGLHTSSRTVLAASMGFT